jgi:lipopolysaccharide/colanic/teichoic acid biosynthesis glycosyltransferase
MIARAPVLTWRNADQPTPTESSCALLSPAKFSDLVLHLLVESSGAQCLATLLRDAAAQASPDAAVVGSMAASNHGLSQDSILTLRRVAKRALDLLLSSVALLLLWPLMLLIAVAIKLESSGPVIFPSLRAGEKGIPFPCYKFRTMVPGANGLRNTLCHLNQRRGPFFKIANDPRVTRLGKFLRKYSLDELPQLWNVLKGDMSLVGPRPHPLEDVQQYRSEHEERLEVKPGMTGLWQVTARANPSFDLCMLLDVGYIRHWSLLLDCKILLRTIPAVLAGEGQ